MGLLNLDEFDRIPEKKHPLLKNLMQLSALNLRKAYRRHSQALPRIASFIGTSNSRELLSDLREAVGSSACSWSIPSTARVSTMRKSTPN